MPRSPWYDHSPQQADHHRSDHQRQQDEAAQGRHQPGFADQQVPHRDAQPQFDGQGAEGEAQRGHDAVQGVGVAENVPEVAQPHEQLAQPRHGEGPVEQRVADDGCQQVQGKGNQDHQGRGQQQPGDPGPGQLPAAAGAPCRDTGAGAGRACHDARAQASAGRRRDARCRTGSAPSRPPLKGCPTRCRAAAGGGCGRDSRRQARPAATPDRHQYGKRLGRATRYPDRRLLRSGMVERRGRSGRVSSPPSPSVDRSPRTPRWPPAVRSSRLTRRWRTSGRSCPRSRSSW